MKTPTPRTNLRYEADKYTSGFSAYENMRDHANELESELYESAKVIRRLLSYADRTAENHPNAVTSLGQNARVRAGIWLAQFERKSGISAKSQITT